MGYPYPYFCLCAFLGPYLLLAWLTDLPQCGFCSLEPPKQWKKMLKKAWGCTIGALISRIGFGAIFYYNCNKEPPKLFLTIKASTLA